MDLEVHFVPTDESDRWKVAVADYLLDGLFESDSETGGGDPTGAHIRILHDVDFPPVKEAARLLSR